MTSFMSRIFIANILVILIFLWSLFPGAIYIELSGLILSSIYLLALFFAKELPPDNVFYGARFRYLSSLCNLIASFFLGFIVIDLSFYPSGLALFLLSLLALHVLFWIAFEFDKIEKVVIYQGRSNKDVKDFINSRSILINQIFFGILLGFAGIYFFGVLPLGIFNLFSFVTLITSIFTILFMFYQSGQFLRQSWWQKISKDIANKNYKVVLFGSGPSGAAYQLNQWLSVLEKSGINTLVVVGEKHFFQDLNPTSLPVVYYKNIPDLDLVIPPSVRVVLYPAANAAKNTQLLRKENIKHIFINHGESDKSVNESKFLQSYDKLYLAGEIARQRIEKKQLKVGDIALIGRPQLVGVLDIVVSPLNTKKPITLLYAPTWEGFFDHSNYSSVIHSTLEALNSLLKHNLVNIIYKPHPYTGIADKNYLSVSKEIEKLVNAHPGSKVCINNNIFELMNQSDMLLCDVSSVMNDYLYTNKPIIMSNPKGISHQQYHIDFPTSQAAYLLNQDMANLNNIINDLFENDKLKEKRAHFRKLSLGEHPEHAFDLFVCELITDINLP